MISTFKYYTIVLLVLLPIIYQNYIIGLILAVLMVILDLNKPIKVQEVKEKVKAVEEEIVEEIEPKPLPEYDYDKYRYYLTSYEWKELKKKRYNLDKGICQDCNTLVEKHLSECHHLSYTNLYKESMEDLVTVCKSCHKDIHEHHGKNAVYYPLIKNIDKD